MRKEIINGLKGREDKKIKATFYLNQELLERFKKLCQKNKVAQSRVMEEFILQFCK